MLENIEVCSNTHRSKARARDGSHYFYCFFLYFSRFAALVFFFYMTSFFPYRFYSCLFFSLLSPPLFSVPWLLRVFFCFCMFCSSGCRFLPLLLLNSLTLTLYLLIAHSFLFFNPHPLPSPFLSLTLFLPPPPSTLEVYGGPWGTIPTLQCLVQEVRGHRLADVPSPNPVTLADAEATSEHVRMSLAPLPPALAQQLTLTATTVVAVGEETSIFAVAARLVGATTFSQSDVLHALETACGQQDTFFMGCVSRVRSTRVQLRRGSYLCTLFSFFAIVCRSRWGFEVGGAKPVKRREKRR